MLVSEANRKEHWAPRAKRVKAQRVAVRAAWLGAGYAVPPFPLVVTMTRVWGAGRSKAMDPSDNLPRAFKAVQDELAACIGVDDRETDKVEWCFEQRHAPGLNHVEVRVLSTAPLEGT